jgi:hypothetical protein
VRDRDTPSLISYAHNDGCDEPARTQYVLSFARKTSCLAVLGAAFSASGKDKGGTEAKAAVPTQNGLHKRLRRHVSYEVGAFDSHLYNCAILGNNWLIKKCPGS